MGSQPNDCGHALNNDEHLIETIHPEEAPIQVPLDIMRVDIQPKNQPTGYLTLVIQMENNGTLTTTTYPKKGRLFKVEPVTVLVYLKEKIENDCNLLTTQTMEGIDIEVYEVDFVGSYSKTTTVTTPIKQINFSNVTSGEIRLLDVFEVIDTGRIRFPPSFRRALPIAPREETPEPEDFVELANDCMRLEARLKAEASVKQEIALTPRPETSYEYRRCLFMKGIDLPGL